MSTDLCGSACSPGDKIFSNLKVNTVALLLYFSQLICLFNSKLEQSFFQFIFDFLNQVLYHSLSLLNTSQHQGNYNIRSPFTQQTAATRNTHISLNPNTQAPTLFRPLSYLYKFMIHEAHFNLGSKELWIYSCSLLLQYHIQTTDHLFLVP